VELTKVDRLILSNQYRILEALYPDERDAFARSRAAIEGGYSVHYSDLAECLNDELTPKQCEEVADILEMFSSLQSGYQKLTDQSGIDPHALVFPGFHGNDEAGYLNYAHYLIKKTGRRDCPESTADELNTTCPLLDSYRGMLLVWRPMKSRPLSKDQILTILAARIHPRDSNTPTHANLTKSSNALADAKAQGGITGGRSDR
jgi:uncharacterized protein YfbU (UPF0304 family)